MIVPSFNQGRFIRETIDSILSQDYRPLEVLVLDGASTDNTLEVLKSYGSMPELKWWSEPDNGVTDAVNKGLQRATGEIITIQSSDDVYLPGAIRAGVEALTKMESVALVYGDVEYIDEYSRIMGQEILSPFDLKRYLGRFTYIPQPSTFFRAWVAKEIGGWRQEVSYAADADYWLRIATKHKVQKIDRMMARYRYHPEQRDTQRAKIASDWERSVRDLISTAGFDKETLRFVEMGIHLARYHYTPESNWSRRTEHLYRAAIANPRGVLDASFPKRELLIGREPIFRTLSRIKRGVGFTPRGAKPAASYSTKQKLGALLYDFPRYAKQMWISRANDEFPWIAVHNRDEQLSFGPGNLGARCEWKWTSDLHLAKVFPALGLKLMRRALSEQPVILKETLSNSSREPDVSFIIGHRGRHRLPHLLATLQTIAAQSEVNIECMVVEQSAIPEVRESLPDWVRYVHSPSPDTQTAYCRSLAFNVGACSARGAVLVLHDNDLLVPQSYAAEILKRFQEGYEVINLKRFIFYLSQDHSQRVFSSGQLHLDHPPESVMQNAEGGGSLAVSREVYLALGGFDEAFVGWGGEDNEFWERAQTRSLWPYGYLPFIHLWHENQPEKYKEERKAAKLLELRSALPAEKRIEELRERNFQASLYRVEGQALNS